MHQVSQLVGFVVVLENAHLALSSLPVELYLYSSILVQARYMYMYVHTYIHYSYNSLVTVNNPNTHCLQVYIVYM